MTTIFIFILLTVNMLKYKGKGTLFDNLSERGEAVVAFLVILSLLWDFTITMLLILGVIK